MEDDKTVDPVRMLREQYQHFFSMPERYLLQLESDDAISTFALEKGNKEILQGGTGKKQFLSIVW